MSVDESELNLAFAHDLRQSLRTIVMHAQALQRSSPDEPNGLEHRLNEILAAARRQEELIASLVEYDLAAQPEPQPVSFMPLDIVIQSACIKLDGYRKQTDGVIRVEPRRETLAPVPARVSKVVEKVLHNAIKFGHKGSRPQVEIAVAKSDSGGFVIFVRDMGIGIEQKHWELIFEPFRRLNLASEYPGSGLGLAICRRLMGGLGGTIQVADSTASAGTSIAIKLPPCQTP